MEHKRTTTLFYLTMILSVSWLPVLSLKEDNTDDVNVRKRFVPALIAGAYVTEALWTALLAGTTVLGAFTVSELIQAGVKTFSGRQHHQGCSSNGWSCEDVGCNRDGGSCNSVKYRKPDGKIGMQCQCLYFH